MTKSFERPRRLVARLGIVWREDFGNVRPAVDALAFVSRFLPPLAARELRVSALRMLGFQIGAGTRISGTLRLQHGERAMTEMLRIGSACEIGVDVTFDLGELLTIGHGVSIGHQAIILTTSHELGPREHRAGPLLRQPVTIEDGAWLGPRCVLLPGVTIGAGAVVAAGSLVTKDVAPNSRVTGVPARSVEKLEPRPAS